MEEQAVAAALAGELTDSLQKGQPLDVAHGAANFDNMHVVFVRVQLDAALNFIGDMRDHLHGAPVIIPLPLLLQHVPVHLAGSDRAVLRQADVDEPLVMPQIQVGFRAVVGDEHFAMLNRIHRAGIDVQIRIQLLDRNRQPPAFEQSSQRSRCNPFSQPGNHAACDKYVFCCHVASSKNILLYLTSSHQPCTGRIGTPCAARYALRSGIPISW